MSSAVRAGVGAPVCYIDASGRSFALSGDQNALFVQLAPVSPDIVLLNPNQGPEVPVVTALTGPGRLVDVWFVDLRDPTTSPPQLYLQLFASETVNVGAVPMVSAIPVCSSASYDFASSYFYVDSGLTVAVSSDALTYSPLPPTQEFTLTARVVSL